mgnify:CR=1 FL=1
MSTNYLHGSLGSAVINGVTLCITSWDATDAANLVDVTSTCSQGFTEFIPGISSLSGTIKGNFDLNSTPSANGLTRGAKLTNVKLYFSKTSSGSAQSAIGLPASESYITLAAIYIEDINYTVDVGDVIKWTASFKSSGAYSIFS